MKIKISARKSAFETASELFDESKKAKEKSLKVKQLLSVALAELSKAKEKASAEREALESKMPAAVKEKRQWFEKFHWFYSSNGFLCIAGRDKNSNELLVKKHLEPNDLYFHAEIIGASHCILKNGLNAPEPDLLEAAVFAGVFSKAWTLGLSTIDVYSVRPEQVSKKAPSKQFLSTGEFMIYGKRNYFKGIDLNFAIGVKKQADSWQVFSGPLSAVKLQADAFMQLVQGVNPKSVAVKALRAYFKAKLGFEPSLDELIRMIPEKTEQAAK